MRALLCPSLALISLISTKQTSAETVIPPASGLQPEFAEYLSGGLYKHSIVLFNPSPTEEIQLSEYSFRVFSDNSWKTDTDVDEDHFVNFNKFMLQPGQSFVACAQDANHTVQPNCDQHFADLQWLGSSSVALVYGQTSGDPAYDDSNARLVEAVDQMDEYFPDIEKADNTIARKKEHGSWVWRVLPNTYNLDVHFSATPAPTSAPTMAPTTTPCDSSCTGLACEAPKTFEFEPPKVDIEQCRSEFGFCGRADARYGSLYCNEKAQWKPCCLEKVHPVSDNCQSTCSSDPCTGGIHGSDGVSNQCRGLDGKCGASSEFCNATETPHEVVLHRGFPEQNTTLPLWKPCCKDDGIERSVLRRDESKKWTSYCSHVFCQSKQLRNTHNQSFLDLTVVHHDNDERNGQKHVCKHGLHEHDKCGCECYGQEFGDQDIEELVDANITHFNPTCQITYFRCEANSTVVEDAAVLAEWKTGDASVSECATATEKRWQTCGGNGSVVSYIYTDMYDNTTKGGFGQNDREIGSLWYNSTRHHSVRTEGKPLRETEKWTSYCSHVFCVIKKYGNDNITVVNHHNKERFGSKHICKGNLHRSHKCGCECYNEDFGDEFSLDNYDQLHKNTSKILGIESRYPTPAPTPFATPCRISYQLCTAMQSITGTKSTFSMTILDHLDGLEHHEESNKQACHNIAMKKWQACGASTSIITWKYLTLNGTETMGGFGGGYNYEYTTDGGAPPPADFSAPPPVPHYVGTTEYVPL